MGRLASRSVRPAVPPGADTVRKQIQKEAWQEFPKHSGKGGDSKSRNESGSGAVSPVEGNCSGRAILLRDRNGADTDWLANLD
ncbi:hypothetical protein LBMAG46_03430 [Planctomycetia bacterium]|nr:hypothetical protein LBMAG46_03430 [Planctomycetia bacterium]